MICFVLFNYLNDFYPTFHLDISFKTVQSIFSTLRKSQNEKEKKRKEERKNSANHDARVFHIPSFRPIPWQRKPHSVLNLTFFMRKTIKFPIKRFSHFFFRSLHVWLHFSLLLLWISTQFVVARFIVETGELSAIKL